MPKQFTLGPQSGTNDFAQFSCSTCPEKLPRFQDLCLPNNFKVPLSDLVTESKKCSILLS